MNSFKFIILFILRQIYRLFCIFPYLAIVYTVELFVNLFMQKSNSSEDVTFLVTSVIFPKQKELSYATVRSVYSPEERAQQTLYTINSIKEKVPEAKIVLIEAGLQEQLPFQLSDKADKYIYLGNNFFVRHACDSRFKSLGEAVMLLTSLKKIPYNPVLFFKISGRYFLDENFNIGSWQTRYIKFFYIRPEYVSTRLYSFSGHMFSVWKFALLKGMPLLFLDYPIEHVLPRFIPKKYISTVEKVGVAGADATTGNVVKE
jgi:hypothetical protein